jgi:hypothetical protein
MRGGRQAPDNYTEPIEQIVEAKKNDKEILTAGGAGAHR